MKCLCQNGLQSFGQLVLLGLGFGQVTAQGGEVGLDLRLGAGGTDHHGGAAFQAENQHIGGGQAGLLGLLVVGDLGDPVARDVLGRLIASPTKAFAETCPPNSN